jgi:hypothetical protein
MPFKATPQVATPKQKREVAGTNGNFVRTDHFRFPTADRAGALDRPIAMKDRSGQKARGRGSVPCPTPLINGLAPPAAKPPFLIPLSAIRATIAC